MKHRVILLTAIYRRRGVAGYIFAVTVKGRRVRESVQTLVAGYEVVILCRQSAIDAREGHHAAQFQSVDAGYAVQYPALEEVRGVQGYILIHDELHGLHQVEGVFAQED